MTRRRDAEALTTSVPRETPHHPDARGDGNGTGRADAPADRPGVETIASGTRSAERPAQPDTARSRSRRPPRPARTRRRVTYAALTLALAVAVTASVSLGPVPISPATVWRILAHHVTGLGTGGAAIESDIVWEVRLPRALLGLLVGAGLAVAGVVTQAIARNPLADPYLLGVSQGASVGAVAVIVTGTAVFGALPTAGAAFAGGLSALVLVYGFARWGGRMEPLRLVLSGVAVGFAFQGVTNVLVLSSDDPATTSSALFWMLGSLARAGWSTLAAPAVALAAALAILLVHARSLNALLAGDETAASLGLRVERLRGALLVLSSLVTGVMVALTGGIGFVGLVAPHAVRLLVGAEHRRLLPAAALGGGALLVGADVAARLVMSPRELPIGVVTAIVGAPVLLWLMRRDRGAEAEPAATAETGTTGGRSGRRDRPPRPVRARPAAPAALAPPVSASAARDAATAPGEGQRAAGRPPAPAGRGGAATSALEFAGITVEVSGRAIVSGVTLRVEPGELAGIIGPNGSGKTSLLRTSYRHLTPATGAVRAGGADLRRLPPHLAARTVAAVPQERPAEFALTVREMVDLGRLPHRAPFAGERHRAAVAAALARVGLDGMADRVFATLSGGEKQRALIARALAQETPVLVLDEPTNHLDVRHQLDVLALVRELRLTTLIALHDLNLAAAHCDRLHVLAGGRIVASGPPRDVLSAELLREVFAVDADIAIDPAGRPRLTFHLPPQPPPGRDGEA